MNTECGPAAEFDAYGTLAQVEAGNGDIPAVEFNVVGGTAPDLYPNGPWQPVDFAITNPGSTSVHVGSVTTSLGVVPTGPSNGNPPCSAASYAVQSPSAPINANVPPGTTVYVGTGTYISMSDNSANQDNCQGLVIPLVFASS